MRSASIVPRQVSMKNKVELYLTNNFLYHSGFTSLCTCPRELREFCDTYTLLELGEASKLGYEIRILQSLIYLESEKLFEDYFRCLSSFKIRYERPPPDQDIDEYLSDVNTAMHFVGNKDLELQPDMIKPNVSMRTAIKAILNLAIGE